MGENLRIKIVVSCNACSPLSNRYVSIEASVTLRTIQVSGTFELFSYDGWMMKKLNHDIHYTVLSDNRKAALFFTLFSTDYQDLLLDGAFIQSSIFARVYKNNRIYTGQYFTQVTLFVAPNSQLRSIVSKLSLHLLS